MLHKSVVPGDVHIIQQWEVANSAALAALVPAASDEGKVARQLDTGEFYLLLDSTGPEWGKILTGTSPVLTDLIGDRLEVGDMGSEALGISVDGVTYEATAKVSDIDGPHAAQQILHKHSTTLQPIFITARSNSDDNSHVAVVAGMPLFSLMMAGWAGTSYKVFAEIKAEVAGTGTISDTSNPGVLKLRTTKNGEKWPSDAVTINSDGSVALADSATIAGDLTVTGPIESEGAPVLTGAFPYDIYLALGDEETPIEASAVAAKTTFRVRRNFTLTEVFADLRVAQTSGTVVTFDVKIGGTSIFSTLLTIDNTETTSHTAATAYALTSAEIAIPAHSVLEFFISNCDAATTAKGPKFTLKGFLT